MKIIYFAKVRKKMYKALFDAHYFVDKFLEGAFGALVVPLTFGKVFRYTAPRDKK